MKQIENKEQILKLVAQMLGWYRSEIKDLQTSFEKTAKIAKKKPNELTSNDGENLQHEIRFLSERLGDEDNYEKLEELTNKLAK